MLFKRRDKAPWQARFRAWCWPDRGWKRAWTYVWHRVTRLAGTPHAVAIGCAAGVLASFTPFIGLHFILAALLAAAVGGNVLASALGTFFGNPLSFPFIWLSTYNLGGFLLGREQKSEINISLPEGFWTRVLTEPGLALDQFWDIVGPVLVPMLIGGLPLGLMFAIIAYFPVRTAVETFQERRRDRLFNKSKGASQDAPIGS
ncbi:MAG: DUF2062 domain-containing protein [Rhizobiales bacterium]|nr:DUF2062 domain-containing protein [Hyphomicrobiales bacterium]